MFQHKGRRSSGGPRPRRRMGVRRPKTCIFCDKKVGYIDFKAPNLRNFLTERGKIVPSKLSGVCGQHQRRLARAIKTARAMALLPYSV